MAEILQIPEGVCVLTYECLNVDQIRCSVTNNGAGATVVFVGSTRDSFQGALMSSGMVFDIPKRCYFQGKRSLIWSTKHTAS